MPPPDLDPSVIGQRVVVRRRTGGTGPSGGPEMTDVIGYVRSVSAGVVALERRDGTLVEVHLADVVTWKVVPPLRPLA